MAQSTAAVIIQRTCAEVGLEIPPSPFSSSDGNDVLMVNLLNGVGVELANYFEWPVLDKTWTISTDILGTTGQYALPSDFGWAHNDTFYNVTEERQVEGPKTPGEWAALANSVFSAPEVTTEYFRQFGNYIQIAPAPLAAASTYTLEYTSSQWVRTAGNVYQSEATAASDLVLIDSHLVTRLLKVRFLEARGMATASASAEFKAALNDATFIQAGSPKLRLSGSPQFLQISAAQVGDTGYGS